MTNDEFWNLIESSRSGESGEFSVKALEAALAKLAPAEISAFDALFSGYLVESYSWELWGPPT